jgi:hypothetical protein
MNILDLWHSETSVIDELEEKLKNAAPDDGLLTILDPEWEYRNSFEWDYVRNENTISFTFDTAWSPPIELYDTLLPKGFQINASYYEPGIGFAGIYEDGSDQQVEYLEEGEDFWETDFGKELDSIFGIQEDMNGFWDEEEIII